MTGAIEDAGPVNKTHPHVFLSTEKDATMKYVPATFAVILGCLAVGLACYVTREAYALWGLLAVGILASPLMPNE